MVQLLVNRTVRIASMLSQMHGVVPQDRRRRSPTAYRCSPRWHRRPHDLVNATQGVHRRAREPNGCGADLVRTYVPSLETLGSIVRQFACFVETEISAVAAKARDPLQVELRNGLADAAIGTPHPQDGPIRRWTSEVL